MILSYHSKALKAKAQKRGFSLSTTIKKLVRKCDKLPIRMGSILWQDSGRVEGLLVLEV